MQIVKLSSVQFVAMFNKIKSKYYSVFYCAQSRLQGHISKFAKYIKTTTQLLLLNLIMVQSSRCGAEIGNKTFFLIIRLVS